MYIANSLGYIAHETISQNSTGEIIGVMAKGMYLKTSSRWLSFISCEPYRSPITLNLNCDRIYLHQISSGMPVQISDGQMILPDARLIINAQNSDVWNPSPPQFPPLPGAACIQNLAYFARKALTQKPSVGLSRLLPHFILLPEFQKKLELNSLQKEILAIQPYLVNREAAPFVSKLCNCLGVGAGLTPSGDDFVTGLLLALNRWKDVLWDRDDLDLINQSVVEAAYQKTTTLSANLIELASLGEGDERILKAIDWIMGGYPEASGIVEDLLDWGRFSGVVLVARFTAARTITATSIGIHKPSRRSPQTAAGAGLGPAGGSQPRGERRNHAAIGAFDHSLRRLFGLEINGSERSVKSRDWLGGYPQNNVFSVRNAAFQPSSRSSLPVLVLLYVS